MIVKNDYLIKMYLVFIILTSNYCFAFNRLKSNLCTWIQQLVELHVLFQCHIHRRLLLCQWALTLALTFLLSCLPRSYLYHGWGTMSHLQFSDSYFSLTPPLSYPTNLVTTKQNILGMHLQTTSFHQLKC